MVSHARQTAVRDVSQFIARPGFKDQWIYICRPLLYMCLKMSKRLIQRRWCNLLLPRKYVRFQNLVVVLIGVISMLSLVLLYEATRPHSNLRTMLTARARRHKLFKKNFGNNSAACRLPDLDPFHSSVAQFIKDLGRLNCDGVSYSSFENNVLVVEGEGIVSAQYRKIARTPGNDFAVVLSDPLEVRNDSWSPMDKDGSQKGKKFAFTPVPYFLGY